MKSTKILVKTKSKTYPIYIGQNILSDISKLIHSNIPGVKKICIITDKKIPKKILINLKNNLRKYEVITFELSVNEKIKNFNFANKLIEKILKKSFNRTDCIISFGGGVVSDLSAFISNLTKRGLKLINIPSTLLSQVDASIGGKTSVNSKQGKNLIGTFYQPDFVLIDLLILNSLPYREMVCGYGEILKHSLILDKKFFSWLNENATSMIKNKNLNLLKTAVTRSCKIKAKIISKDEKENNLRAILNFGHTFAHGFEGTKNFSKKLNHGEAVLLGMLMAAQFSYNKKHLSLNDLNLIKNHFLKLNLPSRIGSFFNKSEINKIIYFMKKDKKNLNKKINLVLLNKIGKTTKLNSSIVSSNDIKKFLTKQFF